MDLGTFLMLVSLMLGVSLMMWGEAIEELWLDKNDIEKVQKAYNNALTGMFLSFFVVQPLAIYSVILGMGLGWFAEVISIIDTIDFLSKWRKYKTIYQQLLLQEAIAKGVEIGMKKAKES